MLEDCFVFVPVLSVRLFVLVVVVRLFLVYVQYMTLVWSLRPAVRGSKFQAENEAVEITHHPLLCRTVCVFFFSTVWSNRSDRRSDDRSCETAARGKYGV